MDTIVKPNGKKAKRNLSEEERQEILAKNKPKRAENGQLLPGNTSNPAGRPKSEHTIISIFKDHENAGDIVTKLYKIAGTIDTNTPHKDAMAAVKLIVERFIPQLKATELKVGDANDTGFVYLPQEIEPEYVEDENTSVPDNISVPSRGET